MSAPPPSPSPSARPLAGLRGVGPEREAQLARLGLLTVDDLLLYRPLRYEDRRHFRSIGELQLGLPGTSRGTVVALGLKRFSGGRKSVFELILEDASGRLHCRWWNLPFMEQYFAVGDEVFVFGKLNSLKPRAMDHPETEVIEGGEESFIHINRIAPVYSLTEGLPQRWLRSLAWRVVDQFAGGVSEPFPALALARAGFLARTDAIRKLHFPKTDADASQARRRLALDEFIALQQDIQSRRRKFEARARGLPCGGDNRWMKPFLARLGFKLTPAQTRVLRELRHDLSATRPMRRLLQGDVGSGKTVVAACCALMTLESGFSAALMAPTEILAEQHYETFRKWFEPLGITVRLQTGSTNSARSTRAAARNQQPDNPAPGPILTIGTHALIEAGFAPERLGLVIIDEQHKFGVGQRERLVRKGNYPHLLVMTATPIPRTLGLTVYGELDVSVIDGLPPGRGRIRTYVRPSDRLPQVWEFIRSKLAQGRQAYVVYPRVEDTAGGLKAVTAEFANLEKVFAPHRVGLLHGRLNHAEKDAVMNAFRAAKIRVLLATPLVEVGLDVPNATIMLIENAAQFGLAQLHQLRGRIGRGAHESHCILVADVKTPGARERLRVLESTNDGFKIAEADLKLRGPGEFLGRRQSGLPPFRFADLAEDADLLRIARDLVAALPPP
jgi:ATP-dependent DNA helicase RecG